MVRLSKAITKLFGGYTGKILRVNLTDGTIRDEKIPEDDVLKNYIGCFGLGLKFLCDEIPAGINAADPSNPLVFMTGPLTGLDVPSPTNTTLVTLNYDTGFTVGRSHTHGHFGPKLKFAGYDGVIISGAAEKPVYLWINDSEVKICNAERIWGFDTHTSEDRVKEDVGETKATVAAIGPAGEHLCAGASIQNDKNHSFSHSGVGAVMGSKKLKAIAVYGTHAIEVADEDRLKEANKKWVKAVMDSKELGVGPWKVAQAFVPKSDYKFYKQGSTCSAKNFTVVSPPEAGVGMSLNEITVRPCYKCFIGCSYDVKIKSGPREGYIATLSGGGENIEGASFITGVYDSGSAFYLTDLYDRLGFETSTMGCTLALAFECFEKGLLTKEDTEGLELKWGDARVVETLIRKVANREGWIGDTLAKGPKRAAEIIGGDAPNFVVHIKGSGMNLHDWRGGSWSTLFGQLVGGGAGWPTGGVDVKIEADMGVTKLQDPFDFKVKPEGARKGGIIKNWNDSIGVCWFLTWGIPGVLKLSTEAINAATGWSITQEEALLVGERLMNQERLFNVGRGLTPSDDYEVSPRLMEPPPSGRGKGKTIKPYLRGMVMEYYRLMGWDEKTGKPSSSTLKRLGLESTQ